MSSNARYGWEHAAGDEVESLRMENKKLRSECDAARRLLRELVFEGLDHDGHLIDSIGLRIKLFAAREAIAKWEKER